LVSLSAPAAAVTPIVSKSSPPRNKWAAPRDTLVNVLQNANISDTSDSPGDGSLGSSKIATGEIVTVVEVDEGAAAEDASEKGNLYYLMYGMFIPANVKTKQVS